MNAALTQLKSTLSTLMPPGKDLTLSISDSNLGITGITAFLKGTLNLESLELNHASLTVPDQPDKVEIMGKIDLFGEKDLPTTFCATAMSDLGPVHICISFSWASDKPLPYGKYNLQQAQIQLDWEGDGSDNENPLQYGLISGTMQLGPINVPMRISFPTTSQGVFIYSALEAPVTLDQGFKQLADIVLVPELAGLLPDEVTKVIANLALEQVGILYNTQDKQVTLVSVTLSAAGWKVFNNFSVEAIQFSLTVDGIGSGSTAITAELDAEFVIEKDYRLPIFIRIAPNNLTIGKQSTERFPLPSFGAILDAIGEEDITAALPDPLKKAAITIDTLEVSYDMAAGQLSSVYFQVSMENLAFEPNFNLSYLGLGFRLDKSNGNSNLNGNFNCTLLLGKNNPIQLNLAAVLSNNNNDTSWQFNAYAENIKFLDLIQTISDVFQADLNLPELFNELAIAELGLSYSKSAQNQNSPTDYTFTCEIKYPPNGQKADINLTIFLSTTKPSSNPNTVNGNSRQNIQEPITSGGYFVAISGKIKIAEKEFELDLDVKKDDIITADLLVARTQKVGIDLSQLAGDLIDDDSIQDLIPAIEITPNYALLARVAQTKPAVSKYLMGIDLDLSIDLKGLPLVGGLIGNCDFQVKDMQFLYASDPFNLNEVTQLNSLPHLPAPLPTQAAGGVSGANASAGAGVVAKGLGFRATVILGDIPPLQLALGAGSGNGQQSGVQPNATGITPLVGSGTPASADSATWYDIQKSIGPVQFNRIGFQYKDKMIWGFLDVSLGLGGLTLSLDGLGVGNPINKFDPSFSLKGMGIDFKQGPIEIGGSFLRVEVPASGDTPAYDEYDGIAILKIEMLNIAAIGSYARVNGQHSLFIYAALHYPIGGPSFFFVTGLAAGFGYNRALRMPDITQVATFPLVDEAVGGAGSAPPADNAARRDYLQTEIVKLHDAIYPKSGEYFLAAGIRFSTFELIDSFVLLTVSFGQHFEIDVLGLSTMSIPPPEANQTTSPLVEAQMALKAVFNPDEGFLGVQEQLTSNSYIFSRACHLTGGFAFYTWFGGQHKGDFVVSLGGYHPRFVVPAHYPTVPRLGFNWIINSHLYIKGEGYFALTAHALMAGGRLEAVFHLGCIKAWYIIGADFIISWKPYFYDARVYFDMGVSFTFWFFGTRTITFHLGADLHIWGPDFSGIAKIHYYIVSFTIKFGHAASKPRPISWEQFKTSFLPADSANICKLTVSGGLIKQDEGGRAVVNPKQLVFSVNSMIPIKTYDLKLPPKVPASKYDDRLYFVDPNHVLTLPISCNTPESSRYDSTSDFGIAPMDVSKVSKSRLTVTISYEKQSVQLNQDFAFTPILKRMPRAMWGDHLSAEVNADQYIDNALCGFDIRPVNPVIPGETHAVLKIKLQYEIDAIDNAYECLPVQSSNTTGKGADLSGLSQSSGNRNALLVALGINPDAQRLDIPSDIESIFVKQPQAGVLA